MENELLTVYICDREEGLTGEVEGPHIQWDTSELQWV